MYPNVINPETIQIPIVAFYSFSFFNKNSRIKLLRCFSIPRVLTPFIIENMKHVACALVTRSDTRKLHNSTKKNTETRFL